MGLNFFHRRDCFCNHQFNIKTCSVQGIFKTSDVVKNDPSSVACPAGSIDVMSEHSLLEYISMNDFTD